jgi:hypothetical protein
MGAQIARETADQPEAIIETDQPVHGNTYNERLLPTSLDLHGTPRNATPKLVPIRAYIGSLSGPAIVVLKLCDYLTALDARNSNLLSEVNPHAIFLKVHTMNGILLRRIWILVEYRLQLVEEVGIRFRSAFVFFCHGASRGSVVETIKMAATNKAVKTQSVADARHGGELQQRVTTPRRTW